MTNEFKNRVLLALSAATKAHASTTPGRWKPGYWQWQDQNENGIRWHLTTLFGPVSDAHRKHLLRALRDLEREGLVVTLARYGDRLTHASLTPEGQAAADALCPSPVSMQEVPVPLAATLPEDGRGNQDRGVDA